MLSLVNIQFNEIKGDSSALCIYEYPKHVPFLIKRVFTVYAEKPMERGHHAHKKCTQLLVCLKGKCEVICDDGHQRQSYMLDHPKNGLLIPPTIWAEQKYAADSILMVLTDRPYEEEDYIRDYQEFLSFKSQK